MKPWKIVGPLMLVVLGLAAAPAHAQRRGGRSVGGGYRAVPSRSVGSRVVVAAPFRAFARPYYSFRPRVSVGFGLSVGYPVAFPYGYGYGYGNPYRYGYPYPYYPYPSYSAYPDPYAYSSAPYPYPDYRPSANPPAPYPNDPRQAPPVQGSLDVSPGTPQRSSGGISFEITPGNAQVYVEGQYVGLVSAFSPTAQPLTLAPGRHHVEVRLVGYQTMTFDTEVTPGQVVPYQGAMQR
ncbi:MAG: PEGA domain-containing protein [Acidobacteriota bacterium]